MLLVFLFWTADIYSAKVENVRLSFPITCLSSAFMLSRHLAWRALAQVGRGPPGKMPRGDPSEQAHSCGNAGPSGAALGMMEYARLDSGRDQVGHLT